MKNWLNIRRIQAAPAKIFLPVVATMALLAITFFWLVLPRVEGHLMDRKREMIHALTEVVCSTVSHYADLAAEGRLTQTEARQRAAALLRSLRYGPQGKDYFWVNDMQPRLLVHPYRPDLEGRDTSTLTDPGGKRLFVEFVETVRRSGAGYVDYKWQWQDNPDRIVTKISYVKGFAPWGWIIGTGVYVEDVRAQIGSMVHHISLIFLSVLLVVGILAGFVVWEGAGVESRRRQAQTDLRRSEAQYRLLAETTRDFIFTVDTAGRLAYANQSWLTVSGFAAEQIVGGPVEEILAPEHRDTFAHKLTSVTQGREDDAIVTLELMTRKGRLPVEAAFALLPNAGCLMTARDVSEKKKAENLARMRQEQLVQADKMISLGTLVSGVAHEINNPITSVLLNIQVFEKFFHFAVPRLDRCAAAGDQAPDEPDEAVYGLMRARLPQLLQDARECIARVKRIVGDLKDFAGRSSSDVNEPVELNAVARKAIGLVQHLINRKAARFEEVYAPDLPMITGNRQRLEQVVVNLLVNACEAANGRQEKLGVMTGWSRESGQIWLQVRDTGAGMPPEVLQRLTDPFFTTKRDSGGTGLGLSISDTIVRDHGGRLHFESRVGEGTVATISFLSGQATINGVSSDPQGESCPDLSAGPGGPDQGTSNQGYHERQENRT